MKFFISIITIAIVLSCQSIRAAEYCQKPDSTSKGSSSAQPFPKSKLGVDIMVLMTGEQKDVEIRKFSIKYIYYSNPGESGMMQIDRRMVNTIYYRSGRKEVITPKVTDIPDNSDWEKIVVTEDPADIKGNMVQIDVVEARVEANTRDQYYRPETLEASAKVILKKKAALLKGEIILVKKKSHCRAYGEPPSLVMQGVTYRKI